MRYHHGSQLQEAAVSPQHPGVHSARVVLVEHLAGLKTETRRFYVITMESVKFNSDLPKLAVVRDAE